MTRILVRLVTILILATLALGLGAQTDDLSAGQKKLDPAEVRRLRAVLAERREVQPVRNWPEIRLDA